MKRTPVSLLEQLKKAHDPNAWHRFVELFTPFLYRQIRGLGLQESDAADLVQEVFVILVQKLPEFSYDRHKSFRAWLKAVTFNKWRDLRRRQTFLPLEPDDASLAEQTVAGDVPGFDEDDYRRYLANRALRLMQAEFQYTTWKACWEHLVLGKPAAEVAALLGISADAVYAATYRVVRRLRQELEGLWN